jgi:large subunit ribosomal protein L18
MAVSSQLRQKRKDRQRTKIKKVSPDKLRLSVHRTNKHMYAQIIDDLKAETLVSASTVVKAAKEIKTGGNKEAAAFVGKMIAQEAVKKGITEVVFDRSGFLYHGRIKALADTAREHGLKF